MLMIKWDLLKMFNCCLLPAAVGRYIQKQDICTYTWAWPERGPVSYLTKEREGWMLLMTGSWL